MSHHLVPEYGCVCEVLLWVVRTGVGYYVKNRKSEEEKNCNAD